MDSCFGIQELKALQDLISPPQNNSDSEDDLPQAGAQKLGKLTNFQITNIYTPLQNILKIGKIN